ncbi:MAG TPA: cytochrome c [Methylomirabilota bacterium]|jgi:S-disulfanyl-L-cysteine oxidoreductase SoxD|nr:cytochrome c [Methylomirabilota bacterium]
MSTRRVAAVALLGVAVVAISPARAADGPNLGRAAAPAEIAGWDISISPDGSGLPPGSGTSAAGAVVYAAKCQSCHGERGAGQPNDRLAGGQGTLAGPSPVRTIGSYWPYATTVFDYVRRSMPYPQPQSLTNDEVYALTAYLLHLNGIIAEGDVMTAQTLPQVKMPNRDNFILAYPPRTR